MLLKSSFLSAHPSWHTILDDALSVMPIDYLSYLEKDQHWLPGIDKLFNAFSLPLEHTRYILFGESPYPRQQSANGYAFWDAAVDELWSETGLSKAVNRATSLRNLIKTLLVCDGKLQLDDTSQQAIANIDKNEYVSSIKQLFHNFIDHGFLLLNASLVLQPNGSVKHDSQMWQMFIAALLKRLQNRNITLLLWGKIAKLLDNLAEVEQFSCQLAEHPYNLSFIRNLSVQKFFMPLHLLKNKELS